MQDNKKAEGNGTNVVSKPNSYQTPDNDNYNLDGNLIGIEDNEDQDIYTVTSNTEADYNRNHQAVNVENYNYIQPKLVDYPYLVAVHKIIASEVPQRTTSLNVDYQIDDSYKEVTNVYLKV